MADDPSPRKPRVQIPLTETALRDALTKAASEGGYWKRRSLADLLRERARAMDDPENVERAIAWLQEKWADRTCPYCNVGDWQVGTPLEIELSGESLMAPHFPVMCGNCGQTVLVNAVVAGIVYVEPPEPSK